MSAALAAQLKRRGLVVVNFGVYRENLEGDLIDGPFVPQHWDHEGKLVRLAHVSVGEFTGAPAGQHHQFLCHSTKTFYYVPVFFFRSEKGQERGTAPKSDDSVQ